MTIASISYNQEVPTSWFNSVKADVEAAEEAITDLEDLHASGTYTPTLTAMSVGTTGAVNTATYRYANGILVVQGRFVWGTAGTRTFPTGSTTWTLPPGFTASFLNTTDHEVGSCSMRGTTPNLGILWLTSTTTLRPLVRNVSGSYEIASSPTASVPFTWADGNSVTWHATVLGTF